MTEPYKPTYVTITQNSNVELLKAIVRAKLLRLTSDWNWF